MLTIKRLTPTVTQRYRTGDGATAPARLDKTAERQECATRGNRQAYGIRVARGFGGSKLNRAEAERARQRHEDHHRATQPGADPGDADAIHKEQDRWRHAQADHID